MRRRHWSSPRGSDTRAERNDNPTDDNHPGHAEAVEVVFDPAHISEIFCCDDEQRHVA